jgi:hypothetical protein
MTKRYELEVFQGLSESEIRIVQQLGNNLITGKESAEFLMNLMEQLVAAYKKGKIMGIVKAQAKAVIEETQSREKTN